MKKLLLALTLVLCLAVSMVALTSCGGDGDCEHTWATEATVDTAATCTQEGVATIKCTACGEKKAGSETAVPKADHAYDEGTTVAATCTTAGSVTKTCATCGDVKTETIPATGNHIWQANASVDTLPTCTTDGQKSIKCIICQSVKEDSIVPLPASHEWESAPSVDTPATETTQGQKSIKCLTCKATKPGSVVILPAFNETYSYDMETVEPLEGTIVAFKNNDKYDSKFVLSNTKLYALIDISSIAFNYVTFTKAADAPGFDYAFLTEELADGDRPYYAEGFFGVIERRYDDTVTVHIPEDATYIYIVVSVDEVSYLPESMVFSYKEFVEPGDCITDETLDSYEYPMESIVMGEGSIYDTDNVYKVKDTQNGYFRVAFIDLTDVAFNTIRMGTSFTVKNVLYTFLTEIPEIGDTISYATGYTGTKMSYPFEQDNVASNYEFTVTIPADAKVLVIYYVDFWFYNNFPDYWGPSYIVFENVEGGETGGESGGETGGESGGNTGDNTDPTTPNPLDKLQDATLDEYAYPVDKIVSAGGCVIYWDENGNANKFYANYNNEGVGKYQCAFIEITDTVFNYVSFRNNNVKSTGWAFLTALPTEGELASYATGYTTFLWSGSTNPFNVEIPEDAKYLAIWYEEKGNDYVPESITFSKAPIDPVRYLQDSSSVYQYPMGAFIPTSTIVHYNTLVYGNFEAADMKNEDWKVVIIDITDTTFTQIQLTTKKSAKQWIGWTFLKEAPVEGEKVSVVDGYPESGWSSVSNSRGTTIDIPEDAKYFVYWYQDTATSQYILDAVKFIKKEETNS